MSFQCIGQRKIRSHEEDRGNLVRCTNISEVPSNPSRPEFGWLCSECANAPAAPHSSMTEGVNVGAVQSETREYRDQIESGFMLGMRDSNKEERDDEC